MNSLLASPAVWGGIGSFVTGFIAYQTAIKKNNLDLAIQRETYVDTQLKNLLENYKTELGALKTEVKVLTDKNQQLVEEILNLKAKIIELEGLQNGTEIKSTTRG